MSNYLPLVFVFGIGFLLFGVYILTVNPYGPPQFPIGPIIAEGNNTMIQQRTGLNFNLASAYAMGVISIIMGSFFTGLPMVVYVVLPIYEHFNKSKVIGDKPE